MWRRQTSYQGRIILYSSVQTLSRSSRRQCALTGPHVGREKEGEKEGRGRRRRDGVIYFGLWAVGRRGGAHLMSSYRRPHSSADSRRVSVGLSVPGSLLGGGSGRPVSLPVVNKLPRGTEEPHCGQRAPSPRSKTTWLNVPARRLHAPRRCLVERAEFRTRKH